MAYNYHGLFPVTSYVAQADSQREKLRLSDNWEFDPTGVKSLHLDWEISSHGTERILRCYGTNVTCGGPAMLADPKSGVRLIVDRPALELELVTNDARCFAPGPNILSVAENFKLPGTCLVGAPADETAVEYRLTYRRWQDPNVRLHHWMSEYTLETGQGELVDRLAFLFMQRQSTVFFMPLMSEHKDRIVSDYEDGPIIDLLEWLQYGGAQGDEPRHVYMGWLNGLRTETPPSDALVAKVFERPTAAWDAFRMGCPRWDQADAGMRSAVETL